MAVGMSTPGSRPRGRGLMKAATKTTLTEHEWITRIALDRALWVCKRCGTIRRADDKNGPCKGVTNVRTR
jgi:hypothetical protein